MAVLHKVICLILFFAQLAVKVASKTCPISGLFQQFKADLCAYNHISLDCNELENLTTSVTLSCATNHSSVISVTQALLQFNNSTIGTTCHDYIRNPLVHRLCNKLCSVTFCSAICDKLKVGFYSVCSYCSNRTTHCVIPLLYSSSSAQNSSSATTSVPTESGSSVFLTRGSTAIIVLLGILCLVCVLGSLARQKKRGRCFESSESFVSCPSEPPAATESTQIDPITIPNVSSCPRESHYSHVQIPIIREHSFTDSSDHVKDQSTAGDKSSSLIEPAPPAYETLESDCSIQSVTEESEEPPPSYNSVVVEVEVAERSISLPDLTVV